MKKTKENTCPGCSHHCPLNAVRCKYGRTYVARLAEQEPQHKHKWEAHVASGGLTWKLLTTSRRIKKALCRSQLTETALLGAVSEQEKELLLALLDKLSCAAELQMEK